MISKGVKTGFKADLIKLNHYTNLQPLCSYINRHIKRNLYSNTQILK